MKQYKIVFLILHYQVLNETLNCIRSIQDRIDSHHYHIVVVDNNSPNQTGKILSEKFAQDDDVSVIEVKENLGFSGGNNIGFEYAKNELHADFICMMNNDTEIIQDDFCRLVYQEYETSNFAVLGPQIHLKDGSICKYSKQLLKLDELDQDRIRVKKLLFKNKTYLESIHFFLYQYIGKMIQWKKIRHHFREEDKIEGRMENVRLHGCCLIFSPQYIQKFDGLDNRTPFYGEEDVLFVRLIRHHLKSVYQPRVKIFHCEEAATGDVKGKNYKKRRFKYETHLETLDMIEKLYQEDLESLKGYI